MNVNPRKMLILMPAYNEAGTIEEAIGNVRACFEVFRNMGVAPEILVIDDGSTDETAALAKQAGADKVIRNPRNMKLGATVWRGLVYGRDAGYDILIKIDADLQHNPEDIATLITPILEGRANIVYGNRLELISYTMPLVRRLGNKVFTWLMNAMTHWDILDSQPGILAVDKNYLNVAYLPGSYNYTQQLLLDGYHKGMMFEQVPVEFKLREKGNSFVGFSYPFRVLPQILMVLVGIRPFAIFGPMAALFLGLAMVDSLIEISVWAFVGADKPIRNVNFVLGTGLIGMQALFFGLLSELIIRSNR